MRNKKFIPNTVTTSLYILVLLLAQSPSHAGVYKWVDENGQVHYGERPGNTGAEKVTIRTNETTKPRAINTDEEDGAESEQQAETAAEPEVVPPTRKEKKRYCNEAKSDLAAINSRGRMREIDEKGNYNYLTEKQRQQRISAATKKKREFCR